MSGVSNPETQALTTRKRGSKLIKAAAVLLVLFVVLVAGGFFAVPMIGASIAKSAIARTTEDGTTVTVESVSLSWNGPQRANTINLHTPDGHDAKIDASLDASLITLILTRGKGDLGTAIVTGSVTVNADALRGETAPDETAPGEAASGDDAPSDADAPTDLPAGWGTSARKPIELGGGFALKLDVQGVDVQITSATAEPTVGVLTATATARAGQPTDLNATLTMTPKGRPTGTVTLKTTLTGLIPASGTVNTSSFATETSLVIDQLATELIALVQRGPGIPGLPTDLDLVRALGPTLDAEISTTASLGKGPTAQSRVTVSAANLQLVSHTSLANGRLTRAGDNTVRASTADLRGAWPALADWLDGQGLDLTESPEITLALDQLDWPTDTDWRTARGGASVGFTQTGFTLAAGAIGDSPAAVELSPTLITIAIDGDSLKLAGTLVSSLDQTPAGVLDLDLTAERFLGTGGALALTKVPAFSGSVTVTDAPAAMLQALLTPDSPIVVAREVGPSITATVVADARPGEMTHLAIDARADNLVARGSFTLDGALVQRDPSAETRVSLRRLTPTLAALLASSPAFTPLTDGGAVVSVRTMRLDLDALARGGLFGDGTLSLGGDYRLEPISARLSPSERPVSLHATTGVYSITGATINASAQVESVALGDSADAITGVTLESTTVMGNGRTAPSGEADPDAAPAPTAPALPTAARTTAKLIATTVHTKALGEWLGAPSGEALARLDASVRLESEPTIEGGVLDAPFAIDGPEFDVTGALSSRAGVLTGDVLVDVTDPALIDAAMGLTSGLARQVLGQTAELRVSLLPATNGQTPGATRASVSLASDRLSTQGPVRVVSSTAGVALTEPFTANATLTPDAFALLVGESGGGDGLTLHAPADVTVQVDSFSLPTGGGEGGAAAELEINASLGTGPLSIGRAGESPRAFSGLKVRARTASGEPGVRGEAGSLELLASLDEQGQTVLNADVTASGLLDETGAFAPAGAGLTGTVTLSQAPTPLLDLLAGSAVLSNLLGPTTDADLELAGFGLEGGTLTGTVAGARASGSVQAVSSGGVITLAQPAVFELREITQPFSYQFTPMLPVIGALTKSATADRPATVTVQSLSMPIEFDIASLGFTATIDPGTASILAENDLAAMLRGSSTIGNRLAPFGVTMTDGVLRVTGLSVPIGEFMVPASGSYNLATRTEDVSVRLPAAALLAEAIGGDGLLGQVLGNLLDVSLHKSGSLGAKNAWKVETTSPLDGEETGDDQIRRGLNDLLDILGD
ncbi:MAG: hypothetical protein ACI89L_001220 [Phycisphaerales bacterium]|jgi:hypothetical protein